MRIIDLFEAIEDYDYDDTEEETVQTPVRFLSSLDRYKKSKHAAKIADRVKYRNQQRKRYERDIDDYDQTEFMSQRGVKKSVINYKPFKIPLIRFGKFGKASRNFLPAELRQEMGNVTHESGVSCYSATPYKDGYSFHLPHPERAAYGVMGWQFHPTDNEIKGLWNYLQTGKPMDIFLIHGNLKAYGTHGDWLDLGSDGEYLLDTSKPYKMETILPEKIYVGRDVNLVQYILSNFRNGIEGLLDYIND